MFLFANPGHLHCVSLSGAPSLHDTSSLGPKGFCALGSTAPTCDFLSTPVFPSRGYSCIFADVMGEGEGRARRRGGLSPCPWEPGREGARTEPWGMVPPSPQSVAVSCSPGRDRRAVILKSVCEAWAWGWGWWLALERLCALPHTYPHAGCDMHTSFSPEESSGISTSLSCRVSARMEWEIGESSELGGIRDAGEGGRQGLWEITPPPSSQGAP